MKTTRSGSIVLVLMVVFVFWLIFHNGSSSPDPVQSTTTAISNVQERDPTSCLERGKRSSEVDEYEIGTTITGTIKNNCGKDFSYVEIDFKLFDHKGNVVGTAMANQTNLKAGETWRYKAVGEPAYSNRFDSDGYPLHSGSPYRLWFDPGFP